MRGTGVYLHVWLAVLPLAVGEYIPSLSPAFSLLHLKLTSTMSRVSKSIFNSDFCFITVIFNKLCEMPFLFLRHRQNKVFVWLRRPFWALGWLEKWWRGVWGCVMGYEQHHQYVSAGSEQAALIPVQRNLEKCLQNLQTSEGSVLEGCWIWNKDQYIT